MFIGHFALAFAARRAEKGASLGTYMAAAQFPDLLWPYLPWPASSRSPSFPATPLHPLRFDVYPISHSLLTVVAWGPVRRPRTGGDGAACAPPCSSACSC